MLAVVMVVVTVVEQNQSSQVLRLLLRSLQQSFKIKTNWFAKY